MRQEGDTIVVLASQPVLVTATRLVLIGGLRIRIIKTRHTETQGLRLRTKHAEADQDGETV